MPALTVNVNLDEHPAQEAFVDDRNTETGYIGGVGSGKTAGGVLRAGRHVSEWNPGHTGVIVSPTVPMLRNVITPELRQWGLLDKPGIEHRRSENRIEYPNGSTIILESANNDRKIERLRGLNLAWAWMDEAAYLPEKVYRILNDRLRVGEYRNLFVTTTPRGFNWLYDVFGDIDGETRPVADGQVVTNATTTSITGVSTSANPGNPADYIEREKRQHTGQSYQQEVEGQFVQFEGLVYPWFGGENVVDSAPDSWDETIYGVDWGHNNPSTIIALVRVGERWYAVEEYYERRQTVNDHSRALADMQERWGPGLTYCDPAEPANIEQFRRDGLGAKKAENDVTPGIQHVSSMHDKLRVVESCQNLRNEFNQYQYKDDDDDRPEKVNDHLCFVSGTQILTERGERSIEAIEAGDRVLTRDGFKRVTDAGKTADSATVVNIHMSNGRVLTATPNHPIHTSSDGFKQALSLRYGDLLTPSPRSDCVWSERKQSGSTGSRSGVIQIQKTAPTGCTTAPREITSMRGSDPTIEKCGSTTTDQSPTATSSTTKTATRSTMTSKTSNVSQSGSTPNDIRIGAATTSPKPRGKRLRNGINLKKAGNGTRATGTTRSPKLSTRPKKSATNAKRYLMIPARMTSRDSAQTRANRNGGGSRGGTTKSGSAKPADNRSQSTNTATRDPVHVVAVEHSCRGRSVYNLTVEESHEYYANGVLVHNCDALRYALFSHAKTSDPVSDERFARGF